MEPCPGEADTLRQISLSDVIITLSELYIGFGIESLRARSHISRCAGKSCNEFQNKVLLDDIGVS